MLRVVAKEIVRLLRLVRARTRAVHDKEADAFTVMLAESRAAVTEWRYTTRHGVPHRLEPLWAERRRDHDGWIDPSKVDADDLVRVGFDVDGAAALVEAAHWRGGWSVKEVWSRDDTGTWIIDTHPRRVTLLLGPPGRINTIVWGERDGHDLGVERWTWEGAHPVRGAVATAGDDRWASAHAFVADLDEGGNLLRLRDGWRTSSAGEDDRLAPEAVTDALLEALVDAQRLPCDRIIWRADLHVPEPHLSATDDLVRTLSDGLVSAVRAAVTTADVDRPFVVSLGRDGSEFRTPLPGLLRIGSERFRDEMRRFSSSDGEALRCLWAGTRDGTCVEVALADYCDAATLRACRELNTATERSRKFDDPDRMRAEDVIDLASTHVSNALNASEPIPGTTESFLVLVEIADRYGDDDGIARARHAVGDEAVDRFLASVASRVDVSSAALLPEARVDRTVLARWLSERGLGAYAERLAQEVAIDGFRLRSAGSTCATRSRIGGDGLVPSGSGWIRTREGRPLSFVAGIDLSEVPLDDRHGVGPRAGWLLFWVDLNDEGQAEGFIGEPTPNEEGAAARVLWVPPGSEPVSIAPPADLPDEEHVRLPLKHVSAVPQLTLPDWWEAGEALGLGVAESQAYDEIASGLRFGFSEVGLSEASDVAWPHGMSGEADTTGTTIEQTFEIVFANWSEDVPIDDDEPHDVGTVTEVGASFHEMQVDGDVAAAAVGFEPDDWFLGAVSGVQGAGPQGDSALLLHVSSIEFQDGGAIQFRTPRGALAEGAFDQVVTEGDSC